MNIWIYPYESIYVAKKRPYMHHIASMDMYGQPEYRILPGVMIQVPLWEWVRKEHNGLVYAGFQNKVYEISDILS